MTTYEGRTMAHIALTESRHRLHEQATTPPKSGEPLNFILSTACRHRFWAGLR